MIIKDGKGLMAECQKPSCGHTWSPDKERVRYCPKCHASSLDIKMWWIDVKPASPLQSISSTEAYTSSQTLLANHTQEGNNANP